MKYYLNNSSRGIKLNFHFRVIVTEMERDDISESDFACIFRNYIVNTPEWKETAAFSAPHLVEEIEGCEIKLSQWHVNKVRTLSNV